MNMALTFNFDCLVFFRYWMHAHYALALGFRVAFRNLCFITSKDSIKQVWYSLKTPDNVLKHMQTMFFLLLFMQSRHYFWRLFWVCSNLWRWSFKNSFFFMSIWHANISIVNRRSSLTNYLSCSMLISVHTLLEIFSTSSCFSNNCLCY